MGGEDGGRENFAPELLCVLCVVMNGVPFLFLCRF